MKWVLLRSEYSNSVLEDGRVIEDTDAHKFFVEGPQTERARQFLSKS